MRRELLWKQIGQPLSGAELVGQRLYIVVFMGGEIDGNDSSYIWARRKTGVRKIVGNKNPDDIANGKF